MSGVTISQLRVGYGKQSVLEGIDLEIPSGSIVSVLGPSGCGKTTLLRAIAGLLPVSQGSISIGDVEVSSETANLPPERRRIGWVPQDASLFPHLNVRENIAFGIRKSAQADARVDELARLVGLSALLDRAPDQLSGGQAQRVSLARALAPKPAIVLLDEPFAALDPMLRTALRQEVSDLLRSQESTALLVTHDQEEALSLSDHIAVMLGGRILQWGTPHEVYDQPATPWAARFLGDTVELPGRYSSGYVECVLGRLPAKSVEAGVREHDDVHIVLRPEWLELDPSGHDGVVTGVSYAGHDALVTIQLSDDSQVQSRISSISLPRIGETVGLVMGQPVLVYR